MANTRSAAKRSRQTTKRTARAKAVKTAVRNEQKAVRELIAAGKKAEALQGLKALSRELDKAAKVGTLHRNAVNRKKSRNAKAVAALAAGA